MNINHTSQSEPEELKIELLLTTLKRRWPFLLTGLLLGGMLASWHNFRSKPIWKGSFEIVLASSGGRFSAPSLGPLNPVLANLAGIAGGSQGAELDTQVRILRSPSVLRPVFEKLRARKSALGESTSNFDFDDWIRSLTIKLEPGTSVLAISYIDTQKSLISPVLLDISDAYQGYSTSERNESLQNGINYAEEQARIYRKRSKDSFRALNSFGMTYGIAGAGGGVGSSADISSMINKPTSGQTPGFNLNIPGATSSRFNSNSAPLSQLAKLNQELIRLEQIYTSKDPSVISLRRERDALQRYIETSATGNIAYPGNKEISKDQAQSLLLRYQELEREANSDEAILETMESTLLSLKLEKARTPEPWQLISTPTVLDRPVSPRSKRNLAIGLSGGLALGICASFIAERMSGKLFDRDKISKELPYPLLAVLADAEQRDWDETLHMLCKHFFSEDNLAILPLGRLNTITRSRILNAFNRLSSDNLKLCSTFIDAEASNQLLIIAETGLASDQDLTAMVNRLKLQSNLKVGWVWVEGNRKEIRIG